MLLYQLIYLFIIKMTRIISTNVLFQKSYEKYSTNSVQIVNDDTRNLLFIKYMLELCPDIIALQEITSR